MRRSNKEVTETADILSILDKCEVMRIGLSVDDKPYIVPMNFTYEQLDGKIFIYFHCAAEGKKLDMIEQNNNVCFEADCSYKTLEAETACNWSAEFESVVGEGTIARLTGETKKISALDLLMKRYGYAGKPHYKQTELEAVTVLKISVASVTGKRRMKKS